MIAIRVGKRRREEEKYVLNVLNECKYLFTYDFVIVIVRG